MGELIIIFFFHHEEDGRSVIRWGPITLTSCYIRCVVALIFFFALSVKTYSIVPSLFYTVTMTETSNIESFSSPSTLIYLKMRVAK